MKIFFCTFFFAFSSCSLLAQDIEKLKEGLNIIAKYSTYMCQQIPLEGRSQRKYIEGGINVELAKLLRNLLEIGVSLRVGVTEEMYYNVARNDLIVAIRDRNECHRYYSDRLMGLFIFAASPKPLYESIDSTGYYREYRNDKGVICRERITAYGRSDDCR